MAIPLTCDCGHSMQVNDDLAGRKVRCRQCGTILEVAHQFLPQDDEIGLLALDESPPDRPWDEDQEPTSSGVKTPPAPRPARDREDDDPNDPEGLRRQRRRREAERAEKEREERDERRRRRREERIDQALENQRGRRKIGVAMDGWAGGGTNAGILGGVLMVVLAIVWLVVGLAFDRLFFYPPILAILGIAAIIRGIVNR